MLKQQRIEFIDHYLQQYLPKPPIPLNHSDHYSLLIAVLLSAQCTDERVNQITPKLFAIANNPFDMAQQPYELIKQTIRPLGLSPQKAKAVINLSQILVANYQGVVPDKLPDLTALPGVGHKTASVVLSQAFNIPAFPVDTHIHRCAQRWRLTNGKSVTQTEKDLKKCFAKSRWNALHLQIIYFAREHCSARRCYGLQCPICSVVNRDRTKSVVTRKA